MLRGFQLRTFVAVALCASMIAAAVAAETAVRRYALPDAGFLELRVPANWNEIVRRTPFEKDPPTIVFGPVGATLFEVSVTPAVKSDPKAGKQTVRERVEKYLEGLRPNIAEGEVKLVAIDNPGSKGLYFSVTDKAPQPGDFKFLTHGEVETADLAIVFTILTNDGQQSVVTDAIAMLGAAQHVAK